MKNINQQVADKLNGMKLSERATRIINGTDLNSIAELFGGLETAEDVERYIKETVDKPMIRDFLIAEVKKGQGAWEMVQDGYAGDVEAYIDDYADDYEVVAINGEDLIHRIGYDEYYDEDADVVIL